AKTAELLVLQGYNKGLLLPPSIFYYTYKISPLTSSNIYNLTSNFNYNTFYNYKLDKKYRDKLYYYFNNINYLTKEFLYIYILYKKE
ncbi:unnamed protein product, partial [Clonostachys rhizophaga]